MASPKLRFKEFSGDFKKTFIKDIAQIFVGRDLVEDAYSPVQTKSHIFPIYSNSVDNEGLYGYYNFEEFHFPNDALTVVGRGAGLGKAFYRQGGFGTIGRLLCLTPKNKSFHPKYLADYINDKLIIHNESGGIPQLPRSSLEGYEVTLPSFEEQTKIASFLSAVDEKIAQLTQKHELLSKYKQGMMQKLFSQQIRFKADDGSDFGEWANKALSNFITKHVGGASLAPSDFVEKSEYEVIPKKAIVPNGYLNLDKNNPTYCSEEFFKANLKNRVDNTYLLTVLRDLVPSGPSIGYIVQYMENTQYILAQGVYGFKLSSELDRSFLIHFSNTKAYRLVMQSIMVGSTQVHIRNQDFFGIEIPVPCLEEQTKIAHFLSAIDQKIEVVAQQIEQAKQWKKGLLQQMFV